MRYEVRFYATEDRFDQRNPSSISEGLTKSAACTEAVNELGKGYYKVAKVQSDDREEIFIIKSHD